MRKTFLPAAIFLLGTFPASAAVQFFYTGGGPSNDEAAFGSLTGLLAGDYVNFAAEALPAFSVIDAGPTGVDFFGYSNNTGSPTPVNLNLNSGSRLELSVANAGGTSASNIRIFLPSDIHAIGLHLTATGGGTAFCFEAVATTSCDNSMVLSSGTTSFFGIVSDVSIGSFQIRNLTSNSRLVITNFAVQEASAETPEPSTMALMGAALIALPLLARRRRASGRSAQA